MACGCDKTKKKLSELKTESLGTSNAIQFEVETYLVSNKDGKTMLATKDLAEARSFAKSNFGIVNTLYK